MATSLRNQPATGATLPRLDARVQLPIYLGLAALIWLISSLLLRGRGQTATFWTVALVSGGPTGCSR